MKITDVKVFSLESQKVGHGRHALVRVDTDEGISGWGSCYMGATLVQGALEHVPGLITGQDPLDVERVTETLYQSTFRHGHGGVFATFISGINIALWDICGKALGVSVGRLLGGRHRDKMKPYASQLFSWPVDDMTDRLLAAKEKGFRAFKLGWGSFGRIDGKADEAMVKAAREAIGDECDLMVDAGGSDAYWHNDLKWAMNTAQMLKDYDVVWFEEPLVENDLEGHRTLRKTSPVWIATGECLRTRQICYPWIYKRAVDVLQPDLTRVGGISEGRRIAWLANDHGILVVFHGWNTAVGLAADLQLNAALNQARYVEYFTPTPYIDDILAEPFKLDTDGLLPIPDTPGLGIQVNEDAVRAFAED